MGKEGSKMIEGMEMGGGGDDKEEKNCRNEKNKHFLPGRKLLSNSQQYLKISGIEVFL